MITLMLRSLDLRILSKFEKYGWFIKRRNGKDCFWLARASVVIWAVFEMLFLFWLNGRRTESHSPWFKVDLLLALGVFLTTWFQFMLLKQDEVLAEKAFTECYFNPKRFLYRMRLLISGFIIGSMIASSGYAFFNYAYRINLFFRDMFFLVPFLFLIPRMYFAACSKIRHENDDLADSGYPSSPQEL